MLTLPSLDLGHAPAMSRRQWLQAGALGAFGLSLGDLQAARPADGEARTFGQAKRCIVLFHLGGPPQHETWDPKPEAPVGIRGDFQPIATRVPGIWVGELMPKTARHLDKICVLRSVSTNDNAHSSSGYWMLTGAPHVPTNSENAKPGAPNDWPCTGAFIQALGRHSAGLPAAITLPEHIWNTGGISWPGQDGGFLGKSAHPWLIHCQPHQPGFRITGLGLHEDISDRRLAQRLSLLDRVDPAGIRDPRTRQAISLLAAGQSRRAFELAREPVGLRERYGMTRWGQSLLLARRLVEAGVSLVQVNWTRMDVETSDSPAWDTHNKHSLHLRRLMPIMDQAYSALLEDLSGRGLLDSTLIVWMGEFGRTPKINAGGGRDHWGHVFSVALAGGGVRGGQVLGASDKIGAFPKDGRVLPQDLQTTIFHCLGIADGTEVHDAQGRPIALVRGQVLRQAL